MWESEIDNTGESLCGSLFSFIGNLVPIKLKRSAWMRQGPFYLI